MSRPTLLVVDDEAGITRLVSRFANREGFDVVERDSARDIVAELSALRVDAALIDLRLPGVNGLELLRLIRDVNPACHVALMTGQASVDTAIEAVKLGALDYLTKPLSVDRIREFLNTVRHHAERRQALMRTDADLAHRLDFHGMIGRSPAMQDLFDTIRRLAPHVRTALIAGETGTGKELVARALHKVGPRRTKPFVVVNCSAIVEALFESELFGHVRGAFTGATEAKAGIFEEADGGTLFLDEIGELPLAMQSKLLRVVEDGEVRKVGSGSTRKVNVNVLTATNRDLSAETAAKRFREDLYYRLNIVELRIVPLRERREDIPYLTAAFVKEFATRFSKRIDGLSAGAERLLLGAPWPGNVRELRNTIERVCLMAEGPILSEQDVRLALGGGPPAATQPALAAATRVAAPSLDREQVVRALQRVGGNKSEAAKALGLSRRAFYRRLDEFGLR